MIQLILLSALVATIRGTPVHYDQRQDGKTNVHAKLDNLLVVVAYHEEEANKILKEIANQAFQIPTEWRNAFHSEDTNLEDKEIPKVKQQPKENILEIQQDPQVSSRSQILEKSNEPYRVEIVRISQDEEASGGAKLEVIEEPINSELQESPIHEIRPVKIDKSAKPVEENSEILGKPIEQHSIQNSPQKINSPSTSDEKKL